MPSGIYKRTQEQIENISKALRGVKKSRESIETKRDWELYKFKSIGDLEVKISRAE